MKICLVSNLYGENARGGAERVVEAEAAALAAAGHGVTVIAGSAGNDRADAAETAPPGVKVVRYRPPNIFFYSETGRHSYASRLVWHLLDTFNLASARRLAKLLEKEKPDVVHTHNLMGLGFLIPRAIRRLKLRHVHTLHDVQLLHPSGLLTAEALGRPSPAARIHTALMRRLFGSPDAVVSPSRFLLERHVNRGFFRGSSQAVVPNPAPLAVTGSRTAPSAPVFLFAGQIEEHKGIRFLLEAWSEWSGRGQAVLEIAGSGTLEAELRERTRGAAGVSWLGRLRGEELSRAYDRAAFTILPSLVIENSPTVIGESFSRGTPVIAAAVGGVPELVAEGRTGYLFPPGDKKACLAAFNRATSALTAGSAGWPLLSASCVARAGEMSLGKHFAALLDLYQS